MYLTIISVFWVYYDHSIRGSVKFITNFRLSLAQVKWNFVDRFFDLQQGPCNSHISYGDQAPIQYWLRRLVIRSREIPKSRQGDLMAEVSPIKFPSDNCHWTLSMISQHWFR